MLFLDSMMHTCSDPALAAILLIVKKVMNIIWIIGPILAIVGAVIAFTKMMANPDEKKYKPLLKNIIIALVMLFLVPVIVNTVMKLFDEQFEVSSCWNHAEEILRPSSNPNYIDDGKKPHSSVIVDPDDYTVGEDANSNNNSSSKKTNSSTSKKSNNNSSSPKKTK